MHQADVLKNMIKQFNNQHNQPSDHDLYRQGTTPKKPTHNRNSKSEHFTHFNKSQVQKQPVYEHQVQNKLNFIQEEQDELYQQHYDEALFSQQKGRKSLVEPGYPMNASRNSSSHKNKENNKTAFPLQPQPSTHKRLYNYAQQPRKPTDPETAYQHSRNNSRQNSLPFNENTTLNTQNTQNSGTKNNTSQKKSRESFMILDKTYLQRKNSLTNCKVQLANKARQQDNKPQSRQKQTSTSKVSCQNLRKMNSSQVNSSSKVSDLENENQVLKYMLQESESSLQQSKKYNEQYKYQMKIEQQKQFLEMQMGDSGNTQAINKIEKQIQYLEALNQQIDNKKSQHTSQKYIQQKVKGMQGPCGQKRPLSNVLNLLTH